MALRVGDVRVVLTNHGDDFVERHEVVGRIDRSEELTDDGAYIKGALILHVVEHNLLILCIIEPIAHTAVNLIKELGKELLVVERCGAVDAGAWGDFYAYESTAASAVIKWTWMVRCANETGISTADGNSLVVWYASLYVMLRYEVLDDWLLTLLQTVELINDNVSHG